MIHRGYLIGCYESHPTSAHVTFQDLWTASMFIKSADLAAVLPQAVVNPALVAPMTFGHSPRGTAISISGKAVLSR